MRRVLSLYRGFAGGSGVRLNDGPDIKLFILVGWGRSFFAWPTGVQLLVFFCSSVPFGTALANFSNQASDVCKAYYYV